MAAESSFSCKREMLMNVSKRNTLLFAAAIVAFAVFAALMIFGFVFTADSGESLLPAGLQKTIDVQKKGDVFYISDDSKALSAYENGELIWETPLTDRTSDVVAVSGHIVVSYVSERNIDVFSAQSGEKLKSFEVPYQVLSIDADATDLYIAAKKGGLKGSVIYHYADYLGEAQDTALSLSNVISDIKIHPQEKILYGLSTDYNIYTFAKSGGELNGELYASVRYEPLALGFSGEYLAVADTVGTVSVFSGKELVRTIDAGMTLCAFAAEPALDYVAAANISGSGFVMNVQTGGVRKISVPTEVQNITLSEDGLLIFSEYRDFKTQCYEYGSLDALLFFGWAKYVAVVLTILSLGGAVFGWFSIGEKRRAGLHKQLHRFKVGFIKSWKSYAFVLPTFMLLGLFMYVPTVWGLILSFFDYVPGVYTRPVGFENFVAVLQDPFFTGGIGNMLIFLVTDLFKALVPAVLIAEFILALNSKKAQYWVRVLIYIPGILPGVAVLLIWTKGIYGEMGLFNSLIGLFDGKGVDWLGNDNTALLSLILIGLPWVGQYILFYGALMSVPDSYKESAKLDGCTWLKSILYIDFPMIRPQLKYVFIITFINSIQDFGRVYMTTGQISATNIPALQMYMTLNSGSGYGRAAAMGMLLFILVFGATLINLKAQKTESNF